MNGILAQVQGQYVSQGNRALPPAATAERREYAVELDAGHIGRVVVYYMPQFTKHHKHSHWFWSAVRAEPAPLTGSSLSQ